MTFDEIEQVCAILREYHDAATADMNGGPTIYEADYAKRIESVIG